MHETATQGTTGVAGRVGDVIVTHNPQGYPPTITGKALAPRLERLDGKTVYLVDARFDDSDIFLEQMRGWFAGHLPTVRTKLVRLSGVYTRDDPQTWAAIQADGDAAIIGVGH